MRIIPIIVILCLNIVGTMFAQEQYNARHFGLSYTIQSGQSVIKLPIVISESFLLAPSVGAQYRQQQGTDVLIGADLRFLLKEQPLTPYFGLGLGGYFSFPEGTDEMIDVMIRTSFGTEYLINRHFSIGADIGLVGVKSAPHSLRFGNPDRINVQTDASLYVTFYF